MLDQKNGDATGGHFGNQMVDLFSFHRVAACGGLIEKQNARFERQCTGNSKPLQRTVGKALSLLFCRTGKADPFQQPHRISGHHPCPAARGRKAEEIGHK